MMDAHAPEEHDGASSAAGRWRERLIQMTRLAEYSEVSAPIRGHLTALLADDAADAETFVLRAESLLGRHAELRALYRKLVQGPAGERGEFVPPAEERKRPDLRWVCPVPNCGYEDWGDRFHPARQDVCPNAQHAKTLLELRA